MYLYAINSYSQTELDIQVKNSLAARRDFAANQVARLFLTQTTTARTVSPNTSTHYLKLIAKL